jgi:hypothetical protein
MYIKSHNKMSLTETINIRNLNRIIENYAELISKFDVSVSTDHTEQYYRNLLPILTRYLTKINKINEHLGIARIDYVPSQKKNQKNKKGRVYAKRSEGLISFPREIRNYLLLDERENPLVIDLDIENAHPVIYYQFLIKDGFPQERLSNFYDYITNRNQWLIKYGKNIKQEIISVINCCQKLSSQTTEEKQYENLIREIWDTQDWIQNKYRLSTITELKQFIFDKNTEIERQIIDIAMDYAREYFDTENGEDPCSIYAYDGFAIRNTDKVKTNKEDFLKRLNSLVYEKVGYFCKFTEKPIVVNPEIKEFLEKPKTSRQNHRVMKASYRVIDLSNIDGQFLGDSIRENLVTDFKEDIMVLDISMAGGKSYKTYSDFNAIRDSGTPINTISILNRISLIDNIKHDYPFVYSYREDSESRLIHGINKSVVCCSESLYRLTERTRTECDVLFLDEIESVLPQMICGETHGINIKVNQENFLGLLISARKIIISDANIQDETINFIKEIREKFRNEKSQVLKFVDTPRKKRDVLFVENGLNRMIAALSSGKRLFVPCTRSIKFGEGIIRTLQSQFPEKKMLYIHSENKGQYSKLLSDTELWSQYEVIMISPCISSGVSCVVKNHFDEVYCFFSSSSSNPYDSIQMIGRVRYPTSENIYIEFDDKTNNHYRFGYRTKEEVLKMLHLNIKDLYGSHNGYVDTTFDYTTTKRILLKSPRTDLFCFNYSTQSKLYTQYRYHLKKALENSYICSISHRSLKDEEEMFTKDTSTKEKEYEYQNERSSAIFNSKNLTSQEIDDIQLKHKVGSHLTIVEEHQQNKYFLSVKSKMPLHSIDKFVLDNKKREPRVLFRVLNSKLENVVKPLGFFINHLSGSSETNSLSLGHLFNSIQFELRDFQNSEVITTKWLGENINGTMLRFVWVEKILKLFGARHIFDAISLTPEEFIERYKKFLEWTQVLCVPLINGKTNFDRLINLFSLRVDSVSIYSQKQLRKVPENKGYQLINCMLRPIGLSFKTDYIRKREGKKIVNYKIYKLTLNYPILLNYYLNPEPISYMSNSNVFLNLSKDTLPVLTTGNIPQMSEEWTELYKASVFYSLPKVRTDKEEDEGGDKISKSEN